MTKPVSKANRHRQLAEDWQKIALSPEGKRIIADLFGWGGVFQSLDENDPIRLAMATGERNFAVRVARYLSLEPEVFAEQMRENDTAIGEWMGDAQYRQELARMFMPAGKPYS